MLTQMRISILKTEKKIKIIFKEGGNYLVDNVSLLEDSLIKNGSFNAGLAGYEPYAYTPDNVSWVVDNLSRVNM